MLVRDLEQVKHDPVQEVNSRRTPPNRQTSPMCAGVATKPADPLKADLSPAGLDAQTTCSAPGCSTISWIRSTLAGWR